jgi:hypothetical protein
MKEQYIKIDSDGCKYYYADKEMLIRHRTDGPAIDLRDGSNFWFIDGKRHRMDGPAVEVSNGTKEWYVNNNHHRLDGPAVEASDGTKEWWVDGKRHRMDGPAIEWSYGAKSWYVNGMNLTESKFNEMTRPKKDCSGQTVVVDGVPYKLVKA